MRFPKIQHHKPRNRARVRIDGVDHYLGPWDVERDAPSEEAQAAYDRLIAEWLTNGRRLPREREGDAPVCVVQLVVDYFEFCQIYYRKPDGRPTRELENIRLALRSLRRLYGDLAVDDFGPLKLQALREHWIEAGHSRKHINKQVGRVVRCFKWGTQQELVIGATFQALSSVAGLRAGRSRAKERPPVRPVPLAVVEQTLPFLSRHVSAMVRVQYLLGCRPHEVCELAMEGFDRSGKIWLYRPGRHKTEHHGHDRVIPVGPQANEVLIPFLRLDGGFLFRPIEAEAERRVQQRAARRSRVQPSQRSRAKASPRWKPGDCYSVDSYRRSIARSCDRAGIERWSPLQLRHARATDIRRQYGLEAAQVTLGHQNAQITQVYAERDLGLAIKIAGEVG